MISYAAPLAVGDCCQLVLTPPEWAVSWRVLRLASAAPTQQNDPLAILVYEGNSKRSMLDLDVKNGETWHYAVFYFDGVVWSEGRYGGYSVAIAARATTTQDLIPLIRDRIYLGLKNEIALGNIHAWQSQGVPSLAVPVVLAPVMLDGVQIPVVAIQLTGMNQAERGIGDELPGEADNDEALGTIQHVTLVVAAFTMNPNERGAYRHALQKVLIANMPVFQAAGFDRIELNATHREDLSEDNAPLFIAEIHVTGYWAMSAQWINPTIHTVSINQSFE